MVSHASQVERLSTVCEELRDERAALLAREARVMDMVDKADREYRVEKRRFEETERDLRQRVKDARDELEREREMRESGNERESNDARELGALRRRVGELEGECDALKESNQKHRKDALMAKTKSERAEWLEGEIERVKKLLASSEGLVKQLKSDLQLEKSAVTKVESAKISLEKDRSSLRKEIEMNAAKMIELEQEVENQSARLATMAKELEENRALGKSDAAVAKRERALEQREKAAAEREREIKESFTNLKARESACEKRERAIAKSEATEATRSTPAKASGASTSRGTAIEPSGTTLAPTPTVPSHTVSRFAELARRYVFTPGFKPRLGKPSAADSPTPTKTPLSEKSRQLFAAVVDKAQSAAKASATKAQSVAQSSASKAQSVAKASASMADQAKNAAAVGVFKALHSTIGYKQSTPAKSLGAGTPDEKPAGKTTAKTPARKTLESQFPS